MAVAFDAVTDAYANSTSLTFAHTCSGSDRFLVVGIKLYGSNDITGITYNGVSMTHIGTAVLVEGTRAVMYGLIAPSTGANNVVISRTSSNHIVATAASYTGVSQTGQPEASGTNAASGTTLTVSATVTTEDAWLVGVCAASFAGAAMTAGAGTTLRRDNNELLDGIEAAFDSGGPLAAGSRSLQFSGSGSDKGGVVCVLAPAGGGGGGATPKYVFGKMFAGPFAGAI